MFDESGGAAAAVALAVVTPADLEDADLVEAMRAWERLAAWVAAGQLAAIAELARRRPRDYAEHGPGHVDAGDPRVPQISEFAVDEVAAALRLTRLAAGVRVQLAVERTRDAACRFPGCRQPAHRCDIDHVTPWPAGATTADNLVTVCRHHHRLKHQTRWTVRTGPGGELTWTSPSGHAYVTTASEP